MPAADRHPEAFTRAELEEFGRVPPATNGTSGRVLVVERPPAPVNPLGFPPACSECGGPVTSPPSNRSLTCSPVCSRAREERKRRERRGTGERRQARKPTRDLASGSRPPLTPNRASANLLATPLLASPVPGLLDQLVALVAAVPAGVKLTVEVAGATIVACRP